MFFKKLLLLCPFREGNHEDCHKSLNSSCLTVIVFKFCGLDPLEEKLLRQSSKFRKND